MPVLPSATKKSGYLPGLDGWRAIAILGVLMVHDLPWVLFGHTNQAWKDLGGMGVQLFFAISGFLITTRILEEEDIVGSFRLKAFYIRRVFRIQPAAIAYLTVIAVLMAFGVVHESFHHWIGALFLYNNFLFSPTDPHLSFTGHFWTLSVEEHFYIILSLLLYFFRRYRIAVVASVILILRIGQHLATIHGLRSDVSGRRTFWILQYLLTPALCALLLHLPEIRKAVIRFLHPWVAYAIIFAWMLLDIARGHGVLLRQPWPLILSAESSQIFYGFTLFVIATALHPHSWTTRFLELRWLRFIGRLSYSIYLWHVLFFSPAAAGVGVTNAPLLFLSTRPWKYIAAILAAIASYYLIERPMIRVGHRLAPPATPGHRDLAVPPAEAAAS